MNWNDYKDLLNESAEELYENAPCGYISFVKDGTVVKVNKTLLSWLGYEQEEVLYIQKFQNFLSIGGKIFFETHFSPLIRMQGFIKEINFDFVRKNKSTFPVLLNVNQLENAEGDPVVYRATIFDITDRKKYEKELIEAKRKAESAAKAKAEFLATISHEIRTPLNAIVGVANLIRNTPLNEQQKNYARILRFSSDNLLGLVNDILDFSKIEAGKVKIEEKVFSVKDLVMTLIHTLGVKAKEKKIDLKANLDEKVPNYLIGDPLKLTQILTNLIGNAIKFTKVGFVRLEILVLQQEDHKVSLQFTVEDTGIGIPEDKLETIFEEFSQASYDINLQYGGTGLGLTISQKLLQLHGSSLSVKSEVGKGTAFSFRIDYSISQEKPADQSKAVIDMDQHKFKAAKVLVVDDNEINISIIAEYLTAWNLAYEAASNGAQALQLVQQHHYDLILMDLQMPEMDGYQASKAIRQLDLPKQPPIIALSASARGDISEKLRLSGFNDYVSKPFQPTDLYRTLYYHIHHTALDDQQTFGMVPSQETEKADEAPVESQESLLDFSHYIAIANNRIGFLDGLLKKTITAFEEYKDEFAAAFVQQDIDRLGKLIHKSKMALTYIQAGRLETAMQAARELLKEDKIDSDLIQEKISELDREFDKVIRELKSVNAKDLLNP